MIYKTLLLLIGEVAIATRQSNSEVRVQNRCEFPVFILNTPAENNEGMKNDAATIRTGDVYRQRWTRFQNIDMLPGGWSVKMKKQPIDWSCNLLQFEYTLTDNLSYDLSLVNGDPFEGNWFLEGSPGCSPQQKAYRYSTDNTHGMQWPCPSDATITVDLCPQDSCS